MSESVEILIKADDQASKKFADAATNTERSMKRVEQILGSLESPAERYNKQLEELKRLQSEGVISADEFGKAQAKLNDKIQGGGNAFKEMGGKAKVSTEFVGSLATTFGSPEIAGFAGTMAGITEKVSQFSDVAKQGGVAALGFKLGLVGIVATLSFKVGSVIGNAIYQTKKWEEQLEAAKKEAERLNAALLAIKGRDFSLSLEEISLIRDPEEQARETAKLLDDIGKQIEQKNAQIQSKLNAEEDLNTAWFGSPEDRAALRDTSVEEKQLELLRQQRDALRDMGNARRKDIEEQRKQNELQDKSEAYLETLRQEVELLGASREEQIKIEAARNATAQDRGEAERLLRERDAILAKAEAEAEAAAKKKEREAEDEREAARKKDRDQAVIDRIEGIVKSEKERIELQRIEIEQGKEAAKVQALINQGVDAATAKKLAADQAAIDKLKEKVKVDEEEIDPEKPGKVGGALGPLQASESRLLTRGSGDRRLEVMEKTLAKINEMNTNARATAEAAAINAEVAAQIEENTRRNIQLVPTL